MKQLLKVTVAFALLAISVPAFAQQSSKGQSKRLQGQREDRGETPLRGQQRGRGMQRRDRGGQSEGGLFRLLDVDRNGKLSAREIDGAVAALMKLDANKDGTLDADELVIRGGRRQVRSANSGRNKSREDAPTKRGQKQ
ncbi:MAG: hypothetical protein NXI04_03225 [Planctomycetaceae bacterium]|nr:hypothetical protein [Planctomycetaceae bacterium]